MNINIFIIINWMFLLSWEQNHNDFNCNTICFSLLLNIFHINNCIKAHVSDKCSDCIPWFNIEISSKSMSLKFYVITSWNFSKINVDLKYNTLQNTETQTHNGRLMGSFIKLIHNDFNECNMFIQYCGRLHRKDSSCGERLTATLWGKFCAMSYFC